MRRMWDFVGRRGRGVLWMGRWGVDLGGGVVDRVGR